MAANGSVMAEVFMRERALCFYYYEWILTLLICFWRESSRWLSQGLQTSQDS